MSDDHRDGILSSASVKSLMTISLAVSVVIGAAVIGCHRPPTYEECVQRLAAGTPREQTREALDVLNSAGIDAFPTLIRHFADTTPAEPAFFQQAIVEVLPDNSRRVHLPTIGEACFGVVAWQIEGNWPKGYRNYYILTPENTQQWLDAHPGMTLALLRVAAAEESLQRAVAAYPANEDDDTVRFLREHLQKAKEGRWDGE